MIAVELNKEVNTPSEQSNCVHDTGIIKRTRPKPKSPQIISIIISAWHQHNNISHFHAIEYLILASMPISFINPLLRLEFETVAPHDILPNDYVRHSELRTSRRSNLNRMALGKAIKAINHIQFQKGLSLAACMSPVRFQQQ